MWRQQSDIIVLMWYQTIQMIDNSFAQKYLYLQFCFSTACYRRSIQVQLRQRWKKKISTMLNHAIKVQSYNFPQWNLGR